MTDDYTPGPLPEPDLEDVPAELWGQNVVHPALYGTTKMHAYASAEVAREVASAVTKERERCARLVKTQDTYGDPVQSWFDLLAEAKYRATPKEQP